MRSILLLYFSDAGIFAFLSQHNPEPKPSASTKPEPNCPEPKYPEPEHLEPNPALSLALSLTIMGVTLCL